MTTDRLPYAISMDNPAYRASLAEFHRINDAFEDAVKWALRRRVDQTEGLSARFLDKADGESYGRAGHLPWLEWDDDPQGGYWIAFGLQHRSDEPPSWWRTFAWAHYLRDSEDGESFCADEEPFKVYLTSDSDSARDPELIVDMVIGSLTRHHRPAGEEVVDTGTTP